jgi:hypothetical protein
MRAPNLGSLPYFLGGVAVGIFVDRILGGPAGDSGLVVVVSAVAAAFALSGPLLQERIRQGSENRLILREERKDHATEIAETTLQWLGGIWFNPDTSKWSAFPASPLAGLSYSGGNGSNNRVELLQFWRYAVQHFAADADVAPAWNSLTASLSGRLHLKVELDALSAQQLRGAIESTFGNGFVPGLSWESPHPPRCYDEATTLGRLRGVTDTGSFKQNEVKYGGGPESSDEMRYVINYGPEELISSSEPGLVDLEKYRAMYSSLRTNAEFRSRLADLQAQDAAIRSEVANFAPIAWAYFERVKGTKQLPGTCDLCPKLDD